MVDKINLQPILNKIGIRDIKSKDDLDKLIAALREIHNEKNKEHKDKSKE